MKIINENNTIKVKSPYSKKFVTQAHKLAGVWDSPFWVFPQEVEDKLDDVLFNIYGEGIKPRTFIKIKVRLIGTQDEDHQSLFIGGWRIAYRPNRDAQVRFVQTSSYILNGDFEDRGGSNGYPWVTWKENTVIVTEIPEERLDKAKKQFGDRLEVLGNKDKRQALLARKKTLEQELANIKRELSEENLNED